MLFEKVLLSLRSRALFQRLLLHNSQAQLSWSYNLLLEEQHKTDLRLESYATSGADPLRSFMNAQESAHSMTSTMSVV